MAADRGISALTEGQLLTMRALAIDAVTAEVSSAFDSASVPCILLKGPTVAEWLYEPGALRAYVDSDLLVAPDRRARAEAVLAELGFVSDVDPPAPHAVCWRRSDGAVVDLHTSLPGLGLRGDMAGAGPAPPERVWGRLADLTEPMSVGGATVTALSTPARALLVALHAQHHERLRPGFSPAQHDRLQERRRALEDLSRALERLSDQEWREAGELAWELEATPSFARGLRLRPEGSLLAERLGLPDAEFVEAVVDAATGTGSRASLALGFERLAVTRGLLAKARLVLRELFPDPAFLRQWSPLARDGGVAGLLAAYVWRVVWILTRLVPSYLTWRGARRRRAAESS